MLVTTNRLDQSFSFLDYVVAGADRARRIDGRSRRTFLLFSILDLEKLKTEGYTGRSVRVIGTTITGEG